MKNIVLFFLVIVISTFTIKSQERDYLNDTLGFVIEKGGTNLIIYFHDATKDIPDTIRYKSFDSKYYFQKTGKTLIINETKFIQIIIPGEPNLNNLNEQIKKDSLRGSNDGSALIVSIRDWGKLYWIKESDFKDKTKPRYYSFKNDYTSGLLTAPFKFRPNTKNTDGTIVEGDLNLGAFVGWKMRLSKVQPYFISLNGFLSFGSVELNSTNDKSITDPKESNNAFAFNYGSGLVFEFHNFQSGVIVGFDGATGNNAKNYLFQNKPWLSFSLNYNFVKPKQSENSNQ